MPTVRDASFDLLRSQGMTTIFGNPGSTELPMLADFPGHFQYVPGLQGAVVVGLADGFAQAPGRPAGANPPAGSPLPCLSLRCLSPPNCARPDQRSLMCSRPYPRPPSCSRRLRQCHRCH